MSMERTGESAPRQRVPNRQLAALIAEAGFSHAGLARRVDQLGLEHGLDLRYDKTSVTRWLRGQQPRGATPALIAEVFSRRLGRRLTAQDVGLDACAPVYAGLEFAATPVEAVDIVSGLWRKDVGDPQELRRIAFTPAGLVVPSRDWLIGQPDEQVSHGTRVTARPEEPQPSGRRIPQQGRGPGVRPRSVAGLRGARPEPAQNAREGSGHRVSGGDIAALRSVGELFQALDRAHGGGHARQALARYLEHEAEPLLRGVYGEQVGRRLFGAVAELTRLAGWTCFDIAAHGLAQRYYVQALRLSQVAGDRAYGGHVLVTMSQQAVYLGHGREAVQLARVAQQGLGAPAAPLVEAQLYAAEARAHAVVGDGAACASALSRAENAWTAAQEAGAEPPAWARHFDEARLAEEFAHCHRDLRQHRHAAEQAERALRLGDRRHARSRVMCQVVLATALLGLGEMEQACALAAEAAATASQLRSTRAHEYLRHFERCLEPHQGTSAARGYRERVMALG
ncbi:regulator [Streptomyces sp. NPDC005438]|uniref:regulator n=1 Tax=Streptomyces sp. NPDC005438 TaxID=3156880 RepID=UPI0033ABA952